MGSFPCLFKKAAYEVMNFCASTSLTVTPPILSVLLGGEGLVGRVWSEECGAGLRDGAKFDIDERGLANARARGGNNVGPDGATAKWGSDGTPCIAHRELHHAQRSYLLA